MLHACCHRLFQSRYPSLVSHSRLTVLRITSSTSFFLAPPVSPRESRSRSISSASEILNAPEPGDEPLTADSTSASDGKPYRRNRPHVESCGAVARDEDAGLRSSSGLSDR